jgi:hypothetical protein
MYLDRRQIKGASNLEYYMRRAFTWDGEDRNAHITLMGKSVKHLLARKGKRKMT